jgi:hypothetical protein
VGAAVVGFDEGLAVGETVLGLVEGLAVGAAVVGIDQSEGAIVEVIRQREMRDGEEENTPPSNDDDFDDDDSSSTSFYIDNDSDYIGHEFQRNREMIIARNMARITKLGINKDLESKKTTKRKSAPRSLPSDRPSRRNPLRSSRYNSKYKLHDEEESKNEEKDDYEDDGSSEGGVPCAAPSDKEVEGSSEGGVPCAAHSDKEVEGLSERGEPCAAPSDVMNADIMIDTPMSNLNVGSRVLVDYKGTLYNATINKNRVKSGKQEFQIQYDGNKKPTLKWIPVNCIQSNEVASNQPDEVLCDIDIIDSPLTITTGIDLAPGVGASPGVSIYTVLSGPSPERVSIYDNWPQEECHTVREEDIPQETRLMKLVRRLNELKDLPKSKATIKLMKHYTAELKESKMKHEGPYDQLDIMFVPKRGSHRLITTDRGNGIGVQAIPIDTNIDCPGQRPSIKAMVDFAESIDGAILETGVIFRDVSKRYYIHMNMSRIRDNCRWIVSTEGDCMFAFKHQEKMWIKIYNTMRTEIHNSTSNYIRVSLPNQFIGNKNGSTRIANAVFYTFTKMEDTGDYKPTIDHINRKKTDNRWVNLRPATQQEQSINRG